MIAQSLLYLCFNLNQPIKIMKRFSILLLAAFICSVVTCRASDIDKMKGAITQQLLSNSDSDKIVRDLSEKYFPNGVDTDQCLMELVAHPLPSDSIIERLLSSINSDGSWDGILYTSERRSAWEAQQHIKNIATLCRSYKSTESKYYNDKELLTAIVDAITYWCDNGFTCKNWWYNCIGVPKAFAPSLLLLEGDISQELMAKGIKILDPADTRSMTGQNKVWLNGVTLIKGLLLNDPAVVARTSEQIREELQLSDEEGIQRDFSFHQHGAMQQFGNYGLAFAASISYWMRVFDGTTYDFTPEQKEIMNNYITKGLNVTIWNGFMDVSSCGRQLFYNTMAGKAASLLISNINMLTLDSQDEHTKGQFEEYIKRNYIAPLKNNLTGNFSYPMSKYTIHRGDEFFFSVKMFTSHILGGEVTNNENLSGYHLSDGGTMIYRTGHEYENIFPVWDWKYIPGTTVELNDKPLKRIEHAKYYVNGSDFAGCLGEGEYGVSGFEYVRDGVKANKGYFFFSDQVVCLGNSISAESGDPLITTLNQCNYQDAAYYMDGKSIKEVEMGKEYSAGRVFSDGIGYESLDGSAIEFGAKEQVGSWHKVAQFYNEDEVRGDLFTAQIKHADSYGYVVKPEVDCEQFLSGKAKNNFKVVRNDNIATAVESTEEKLTMVIFWSRGEVRSRHFGTVAASEPLFVIVREEEKEITCRKYLPIENGAEVSVGGQTL